MLRDEIPTASNEAVKAFEKIKKAQEKGYSIDNFDKWIHQNKLADESLIKFLKDSNYATKDLANYEQYLKDTAEATSSFTKFTKKAGTAVKSLTASMASMAVMWAIGEAISLVVKAIDEANVTLKESATALTESFGKFEETSSALKSFESEIETTTDRINELQEMANRGTISLVEQSELDKLKETNFDAV